MLENLSTRLQGIFSGLRGKGRLTEDDINDAMREIRMALLEADVKLQGGEVVRRPARRSAASTPRCSIRSRRRRTSSRSCSTS